MGPMAWKQGGNMPFQLLWPHCNRLKREPSALMSGAMFEGSQFPLSRL